MGRLLIRIVMGALFVGHGTQKLFGWFGGGGPKATGEMFESGDLKPGERNAVAAGAAEASGGFLLAAGLLTPLAAAELSSVMITAIRVVHWRNGVWNSKGGVEYPAVVLAALFALVDAGPGRLSLDAARGRTRYGPGWALAQLAAAGLASHLVVTLGRRAAQGALPLARFPEPASEPGRRAA
jgi:putative oxidoreductase